MRSNQLLNPRFFFSTTLISASLVFSSDAAGQKQKNEDHPTTFSAGAELVQVPVIVQKSGKHLSGLSKSDFTLQQDGKNQPIASFEEVHATAAAARANLGAEFENTYISGQAPPQITILALDTVNTPVLDQAYFREELKKYLAETKDSGIPMGLVELTRSGIHALHDFTTDRKALLALVQKQGGSMPTKNNDQSPMLAEAYNEAQQQAAEGDAGDGSAQREKDMQTMQLAEDRMTRFQDTAARIDSLFVLQQLAQSLKGLPGRKTVLWAGSGFQFISGITTNGQGGRSFEGDRVGTTLDQHAYTWKLLNDANVAVYPIDTRRTVNTAFEVMDTSMKYSPTPQQKDAARENDSQTLGTFQILAAQTGGKPCIYRTDLRNCIREAAEDNRDYYLLSFYVDKENHKPGWHTINVKLDQKATARYRNGFIITNAQADAARLTDLQLALNSPFAYTGLSFAGKFLSVTPNGGTSNVGFELRIPPDAITVDNDQINFDVVALFRAVGGKEAARLAQRINKKLQATNVAEIKANGINYKNKVDIPPGEYGVWFVLRDNPTGRTGSVTVPFKVR